jgi:hypothetical protein
MNIESLKLFFFFITVICACLTFILFISTWRYYVQLKRLRKIIMTSENLTDIDFVIMTLKMMQGYAPLIGKNSLSQDDRYSLQFRIYYSINFLEGLKIHGDRHEQ